MSCGTTACECPMVAGPKPGDHMLVAGMTQSGKTAFVTRMLTNKNSNFDNIIIFCARCSAEQESYKKLRKHVGDDNFFLKVGLPDDTEQVDSVMKKLEAAHKLKKKTAIVIDDLVLEQKGVGGKMVKDLFLGARHLNASVIMISQAPSASDRFTRLQTSIFVLFRCGLADGIQALARQLHPESKGRRIMDMFRFCTKKPFGHLIIDTRSEGIERFRDSSFNCAVERI